MFPSISKLKTFSASHLNYLLVLTVILSLFIQNSHAETYVSGEVSGRWSVAESPYVVTDTLIIPYGERLLIDPGVEIFITGPINDRRLNIIPIIVAGELRAIGSEEDSIRFTSELNHFNGFITPADTLYKSIHLEYCVVNSATNLIFSNSGQHTFRHCHFFVANDFFYGFDDRGDTLEYNHFHALSNSLQHSMIRFSRLPNSYHHNTGRYHGIDIDYVISPVIGNEQSYIRLAFSESEVYDNELMRTLSFASSRIHAYDNILFNEDTGEYGTILVGSSDSVLIENHRLGQLRVSGTDYFHARNNVIIGEGLEIEESTYSLEQNLIVSSQSAIYSEDCIIDSVCNNTFLFSGNGIRSRNTNVNTGNIINNIFIGDGINDICLFAENGSFPTDIDYNCFFQTEIINSSLTVGEHNIISNPVLGTTQFSSTISDYYLSASSPCIDSGDPDSPLDEDNTTADIGAFFYDQRLDNLPTITSPSYLTEHAGSYFSYTATAVDDFGPIEFTFENLPRGIEVITEELNWIADSVTVAGNIPVDIPGFTFTVIATDVIGQADTQYVYVDLEAMNILGGEISGILPSSGSPYLVVENLVIPEGDSLVVEPGTQLIFKYDPIADRRKKIDVYGKLISQGTVSDSIYYFAENGWQGISGWNGLDLFSPEDTTLISYSNIRHCWNGINLNQEAKLKLQNSSLTENRFSLSGYSGDYVLVKNCEFNAEDDSLGMAVYVHNVANANIKNSFFYKSVEFWDTSAVIIDSCSFIGEGRIYLNFNTEAFVIRNKFFNSCGTTFLNYSNGIFANNLCVGNYNEYYDALRLSQENILVVNNHFINCNKAIFLYYYNPEHDLPQIYNNNLTNNNIAIYSDRHFLDLQDFGYNNFFNNDTLLWNCSINGENLFLDPLFSDTSTYYLSANSPCIDAGNPDIVYNDVDGTRNDIGLHGGPYGQSYEYEIVSTDENVSLPKGFNIKYPYPNPFNNTARFSIQLPEKSYIEITAYNILGKQVDSIFSGTLKPGEHRYTFNAENLSSGLYFIKIKTSKAVITLNTVLIH